MAESNSILLRVIEAKKTYRGQPALQDVSFDLHAGELLGLLGPNGAGKTTLIRCLSEQLSLDAGELEWHPSKSAVPLGLVPQSLAIYQDLTAEQNLSVFGRLNGVPRSQLKSRVHEALEWANLKDRRRDLARTFSGGMQRRLNIACSILHQPKVLLLDEPTVGVDPQSRERIYDMLDQLKRAGIGILLTTHHLEEAQFRCDRIAIIDKGHLVKSGTLDELISATIGHRQQLTINFAEPLANPVGELILDEAGRVGRQWLQSTSSELSEILHDLQLAGRKITRINVESPNLHQVFIQLTGKELRE